MIETGEILVVEPQTTTETINSSPITSTNNSTTSSPLSWSPDVINIIYSLSNWLRGIQDKEFDEEEYKEREVELWKDWEWVLSTTEEFVLKQNQVESEKVLGELNNLKKTASNLKLKPFFINRASEIIKTQSSHDIDTLKSSLDSNKRSAVITTTINTMEDEWLSYIKEKFFKDELETDTLSSSIILKVNQQGENLINNQFNNLNNLNNNSESVEDGWEEDNQEDEETKNELKLDSTTFDMIVLNKNINKITWSQFIDGFRGQKYSKGINARMKDIGFQASHGFDGSLNSRVLGDITWSIWNTLNTALKQIRELSIQESDELVEKVCLLQPVLLKLWLNTKINSRIGVKNEGIVVEKWKSEDILKKKKILEMKKSGKLDKYTGEKTTVLDHEKREISSLRSKLEKKLKLRTN